MDENIPTISQFYGVYLLYCTNPKYKGHTYIGYTVNPSRRIKQHNRGRAAGGAYRTNNKGPWTMVLIIHGFPNDVTALRFEWAWQHPQESRRLQHIPKKKSNERVFDYRFRILSEMLRVGPWNRLALTIRWLDDDYIKDFPVDKLPPLHMPICQGPVLSKKVSKNPSDFVELTSYSNCMLCFKKIDGKPLTCINPKCDITSHLICLAKLFLSVNEYVPIDGVCPRCNSNVLWGDLVRKYKGYCDSSNVVINTDVVGDFSCSDGE